MEKNKNESELTNKVINLCLLNSIKNQIELDKKYIQYLEDSKPLFFRRKKLKEHNKEIEEYQTKIKNTYLKIAEEFEEIKKIQKGISE